jgi:flagellar biosynthesis/type III secretory pathway chaperone
MNEDSRHRLEDLLDREIAVARLLSTTLTAERSALTGDAPEAVLKNAADKVQLLDTIERLEGERRELCTAAMPSAADRETVGDGLGMSGVLGERWRALMELMAGCRTANEVNGYIIRVRQNQIRQLMDLVRGASPAIYGPQGKTFAKALRALARA